ncbi:Cullin-5 [Portunus trituberculatus]|uniref:Cullin-5 n=1 Tax=Portunus trituberculatus TaxID=210409 RepID=A0A5B7JN00_PORTR|nr:Cullin-5 [Portunus trituberculatus]
MSRVPDGIQPMLDAMEEHIVSAGLADMVAAADTITQVTLLVVVVVVVWCFKGLDGFWWCLERV